MKIEPGKMPTFLVWIFMLVFVVAAMVIVYVCPQKIILFGYRESCLNKEFVLFFGFVSIVLGFIFSYIVGIMHMHICSSRIIKRPIVLCRICFVIALMFFCSAYYFGSLIPDVIGERSNEMEVWWLFMFGSGIVFLAAASVTIAAFLAPREVL